MTLSEKTDNLLGKAPLKLDDLIGDGFFIQNHQTHMELLRLVHGTYLFLVSAAPAKFYMQYFRIFKVHHRSWYTNNSNDHDSLVGQL